MKGNALLWVIIILAIFVVLMVFLNIGGSIKTLNQSVTNIKVNVNLTGTFNQSLNTSDNVQFKNLDITENITIGDPANILNTFILPRNSGGVYLGDVDHKLAETHQGDTYTDVIYESPDVAGGITIGGQNAYGTTKELIINDKMERIFPLTDNSVDLGANSSAFKDLWLAGNIYGGLESHFFFVNSSNQQTSAQKFYNNETAFISNVLVSNESDSSLIVNSSSTLFDNLNISNDLTLTNVINCGNKLETDITGKVICGTPIVTGASYFATNTTGFYLYNDSQYVRFNETQLNNSLKIKANITDLNAINNTLINVLNNLSQLSNNVTAINISLVTCLNNLSQLSNNVSAINSSLANLRNTVNTLYNNSLNTSNDVMFKNINVTNVLYAKYLNASVTTTSYGESIYTDIGFKTTSEGGTSPHRILVNPEFEDTGNTGDTLTISSGNGAEASTVDLVANGGAMNVYSGNGGANDILNGLGGNAGLLTIQGGSGGAGTLSGFGGNGGIVVVKGGNGGTGDNGGGAGGSASLIGGDATSGNTNGANAFVYGGEKVGTGSVGNTVLATSTGGVVKGRVGIGTRTPLAYTDIRSVSGITTLQVTGNVSILGTGSNLTLATGGKITVGGRLALNYSINANGNINASAYVTNGSDYAEAVPKLLANANITSGDIIAMVKGRATKVTSIGDSYFVVSEKAGILSGDSGIWDNQIIKFNVTYLNETTNETYIVEESDLIAVQKTDYTNSPNVPIAFIGQVKVKIASLSACVSGNWVIPSGNNDGLGVCINPKSASSLQNYISYQQQKVCIAWENKEAGAESKINCAITVS